MIYINNLKKKNLLNNDNEITWEKTRIILEIFT